MTSSIPKKAWARTSTKGKSMSTTFSLGHLREVSYGCLPSETCPSMYISSASLGTSSFQARLAVRFLQSKDLLSLVTSLKPFSLLCLIWTELSRDPHACQASLITSAVSCKGPGEQSVKTHCENIDVLGLHRTLYPRVTHTAHCQL
jgi:hypothetical protein